MQLTIRGAVVVLSVVVAVLAVPDARGQCTTYNVSGSAPASFNWTDTTAWIPAGYPGSATCDNATNTTPTQVIVDTVIPNAIGDLLWNCSSCEIDIVAGGQLRISGSGNVAAGASIVVDGGTLVVDTSAATPLTFQGGARLHLKAGLISGSGTLKLLSGATLDYDTAASPTIDGVVVVNEGTISLVPSAPADLTITNGATIDNTSLGTISIGDRLDSIYCGTGSELIRNAGLFQMNGNNRTTVHTKLDNVAGATGVVVNAGVLSLAAGGNGDAPFAINGASALEFPTGSSYTMTPNGTVSGTGTLVVSGGTLSIGGVTAPGYFTMIAGTLTGAGFLTVAHDFTWSGGTITGTGGTQIEGTGHGLFTGADGPMFLDGRAFDEYGYAEYSATTNPLTLGNGAVLAVYGTLDLRDDGTIACNCATPAVLRVSPNGNLVKSGGTGVFLLDLPVENDSAVAVFAGELQFAQGGTHTGVFFGSSDTVLRFNGSGTVMSGALLTDGDAAFTGGSTDISGAFQVNGTLTVDGPQVTLHDPAATNDLALLAGALDVIDFTMTGDGTWSGGTIRGTAFTVANGATLTIDGTNGMMFLSNATLTNDGTILYAPADAAGPPAGITTNGAIVAAGHLELEDGVIANNGSFDIQNDGAITVGAGRVENVRRKPRTDAPFPANSFQNVGTFQKSGGGGTSTIEPDVANSGSVLAQSGRLEMTNLFDQSAGETVVGPGSVAGSLLTMTGGSLTGSGDADLDVQNDGGTVAPGTSSATGVLNITGNYAQSAAGTLEIDLGGSTATDFDRVSIGGAVTLGGTFTATLIHGYEPADATTFAVVTFPGPPTGVFAAQNLPTYAGGLGTFTSQLNSADFTLTAHLAPTADLSLTKNGPNGVAAGSNIVYTIVVTNGGPNDAANVVVSDPTPANLTFVSNSGGCTTPFPCNLGTMASGQSVTITSTFSLTSSAFTGDVTNTASVSSSTADPDSGDLSATKVTNVGAQADLDIVKSGPASVSPGQDVVYTVTVHNAGPSAATNVVVSDPTPNGIAFQSNSGACAGAYPCTLGTLAAGSSVVITSTYTVPNNYAGTDVVNTATVTSDVNDPDPSDNASMATTAVAPQADLAIAKTGPASVSPGQLITYTITINNLGPSTATGVAVSDPTPPGLTPVSNSGDCTTAFPCNIASIAAGSTATINATFSVPPNYGASSITNTATVSSPADPASGNNTSTVTTPVVAQADVSIVKSGPSFFVAGQDVTYTLTVTNQGPLVANNVFVDDPTPAGTTFVANTGACSGPFPCGLGSLAAGQSATITTTFHVPAAYSGTSVVNTASVSSSTIDVNGNNNSSTATTPRASGGAADLSVQKTGPGVTTSGTVEFVIAVTNNGPNAATGVTISDPTPPGLVFISASGACSSFPCNLASIAPQHTDVFRAKYFVQAPAGTTITNTASATSAETDPQPANNSASVSVQVEEPAACPSAAPQLVMPICGAAVTSPVHFAWTPVLGATQYIVSIDGPAGTTTLAVANTSASATLPAGAYTWTVRASSPNCGAQISAAGSFVICGGEVGVPVASAIAETTTGQTFTIAWDAVGGAAKYELQQAADETFTSADVFEVTETQTSFAKSISAPTPFFYRVRAISTCGRAGRFSPPLRVAVVPVPEPTATTINVNVPVGSTTPVTWQLFVPGQPGGSTTFIATVDKPWLSVTPTSGIIPAAGMLVMISADPSSLPNGTWTGTVLVVYGSVTVAGAPATNGTTPPPPFTVPVSISLVTPVTPGSLTAPANSALIIPAVGHLAGLDSTWRSDVRLANTAALLQKYRVTFNPGSGNSAELLKSTTVTVDPGSTTALDDIVRKWFGTGSLGESSNGALVIEPLEGDGKVSPAPSKTTAVSSRTFNASATGTLGQFIPALPFGGFITKSVNSILSLQQLAQTSAYRSNIGLLEASGKPATVLVSAFDDLGLKLFDLPASLRGGEQRQLNALFAERGFSVPNARIQVNVTEGEGKVTTYASVVDNSTGDPFLVFGVPAGSAAASKFVVPGVADLQGGTASWRSDVRVFNASTLPQNATLTFFPAGDPLQSAVKSVTFQPGEVKALDNVLGSLFGLANVGGALHVTTDAAAPLVVSARTYDQRPGGTVGQFIPAVSPGEAVALGGRALQILQTEESARFRTNVGVAEVGGQAVTLEISVHLPDSKITPVARVSLAANEFRQLPILASLNLGALYNTRIAVRVVEGQGRVTAYGSVIDRSTGDPTYIPGQ